jgi:hypothetical protein
MSARPKRLKKQAASIAVGDPRFEEAWSYLCNLVTMEGMVRLCTVHTLDTAALATLALVYTQESGPRTARVKDLQDMLPRLNGRALDTVAEITMALIDMQRARPDAVVRKMRRALDAERAETARLTATMKKKTRKRRRAR